MTKSWPLLQAEEIEVKKVPFVLPFSNKLSAMEPFCGGKGSSLALMTQCDDLKSKFYPKLHFYVDKLNFS